MTIDDVLANLDQVEPRGDYYMAICPCHEDQTPSLKVSRGATDGKVLLRCFAGCTFEEVMEEVVRRAGGDVDDSNLEEGAPLEPGNVDDPVGWYADKTGLPREFLEAQVDWTDDGWITFTFPTGAYKGRRAGDGGHEWGAGSAAKNPMWPAPESTMPEHLILCEGESDALTARFLFGDDKDTSAHAITAGAKDKATLTHEQWAALHARGVRRVTVVGDGDTSGRKWARAEGLGAAAAGIEASYVSFAQVYDPFGTGIDDLNEMYRAWGAGQTVAYLNSNTHTLNATRVTVRTLDTIRDDAQVEVDFIVQDLIARSEKVGLIAPQKTFKTWVALALARAVATGTWFLNTSHFACPHALPVLYLQEEGDKTRWSRRVDRVFADVEDAPFFDLHRMGFSFLNPYKVEFAIEQALAVDAALLILDPWQRMIPGVNENDAAESGAAWDAVNYIQENVPGAAPFVLHHANKSGARGWNSIRGSSRFGGEVDLALFIEKGPDRDDDTRTLLLGVDGRDLPANIDLDSETRLLRIDFPKDAPEHLDASGFEIHIETPAKVGHPGKFDDLLAKIEALDDTNPMSRQAMADAIGVPVGTFKDNLPRLIEENILELDGSKVKKVAR